MGFDHGSMGGTPPRAGAQTLVQRRSAALLVGRKSCARIPRLQFEDNKHTTADGDRGSTDRAKDLGLNPTVICVEGELSLSHISKTQYGDVDVDVDVDASKAASSN